MGKWGGGGGLREGNDFISTNQNHTVVLVHLQILTKLDYICVFLIVRVNCMIFIAFHLKFMFMILGCHKALM